MGRPSVAILGSGRAGTSIGLALSRAGYPIAAVWSRSEQRRADAARVLRTAASPSAEHAASQAELVFLTVPDDAIEAVAHEVADAGARWVVHTSGVTSVRVLAPAAASGARVACLHPLQTLPDATRGADALTGAAVAVTCDPADAAFFHGVASDWGGVPFDLDDADKPAYHAAAVFASNYLVTVLWAASDILSRLGVEDAPALLAPLARACVENVVASGPAEAITGPVVRGDARTVRAHLDAIADDDIAHAYRALARLTAKLAGIEPLIQKQVPA